SAMSRYSGSAWVNGLRAIVVKSFLTDGGMRVWYMLATRTVVWPVAVRGWCRAGPDMRRADHAWVVAFGAAADRCGLTRAPRPWVAALVPGDAGAPEACAPVGGGTP